MSRNILFPADRQSKGKTCRFFFPSLPKNVRTCAILPKLNQRSRETNQRSVDYFIFGVYNENSKSKAKEHTVMKKSLGPLIAEARRKNGMTQLELAEKMGVTDKAVSKWERDLSCPDVNSLPQLAEVLGLSIEELLQGKNEKQPADSKVGELLDTILKAIALAMGVAVAALSALDALSSAQALPLLGLGLASLAVSELRKS